MNTTNKPDYKNFVLSMIHDSWNEFFRSQEKVLMEVDAALCGDITPQKEDVFKIFKMSLHKIRFVVVGQDPYPQKGHATGRSFEREVCTWDNTNASLKAILASIYYHQTNLFQPIYSLLQMVNSGNWSVSSPGELFKQWELDKGVFFLNKSLTTKLYERNSHSEIWFEFISELVKFMGETLEVKWLLWGNEAQKLSSLIKSESSIVKAIHPAAYTYSGGIEADRRLKQFIKSSGLDLICK